MKRLRCLALVIGLGGLAACTNADMAGLGKATVDGGAENVAPPADARRIVDAPRAGAGGSGGAGAVPPTMPAVDGRVASGGAGGGGGSVPAGDGGVPASMTGDAGPAVCATTLMNCGMAAGGAPLCVNVADDEQNCGACGRTCPVGKACHQGACA